MTWGDTPPHPDHHQTITQHENRDFDVFKETVFLTLRTYKQANNLFSQDSSLREREYRDVVTKEASQLYLSLAHNLQVSAVYQKQMLMSVSDVGDLLVVPEEYRVFFSNSFN